MRKTSTVLLLFATLLAAWQAPAAAQSPARGAVATSKPASLDRLSAMDIAGRQRMLSQRMAKGYLLLVHGVAVEEARVLLAESIERFEAQLAALKAIAQTPELRVELDALDRHWAAVKAVLVQPPSRTGAEFLYDASESLQSAAHQVTLALERGSWSPSERLVSLAGRQRMLTQRMAKFHLYRPWEVFSEAADMEMHLSRAHFTAVLLRLERSHDSAAVRDAVQRVREAWAPYEQALFAIRDPARIRAGAPHVAALSERVLAATEGLVAAVLLEARQPVR